MAVKAAVLGGSAKDVALDAAVFEAEVKPHLVHETVRAEMNAARAGTRGSKSRGLVAGGRSKPWRQKGTGRARAGTSRAPHWTGGGAAFGPSHRGYTVKVNRKARRRALRSALSLHAERDSIAVVDGSSFDAPSTRKAVDALDGWDAERPVLVLLSDEEDACARSFRNIERVSVLINRSPEVVQFAADADEHLIQKPLVTGLRPPPSEALGVGASEAQTPLADGLVADHDPARCEDQLDLSQAQVEAVIQPNGLIDDFGRKTEAAVRI